MSTPEREAGVKENTPGVKELITLTVHVLARSTLRGLNTLAALHIRQTPCIAYGNREFWERVLSYPCPPFKPAVAFFEPPVLSVPSQTHGTWLLVHGSCE